MRKNLPPKEKFIGKTIEQIPNYVIKDYVASGSNGHLYRAFNETTKSELAFKVVPVSNLISESDEALFLEEARRANLLENRSVVRYHDVIVHSEDKLRYVIFVCDYVKGVNLREYMRKSASDVDVPFIENFLKTMFGLLHELQLRGYNHGDLHSGNVLVARSEFDINDQISFRITDFGVRKFSGRTTHATDYLSVSRILRDLLRRIDYRACEGRNRYVYNILRDDFLERHLIETDPILDPLACNPRSMVEKLDSIDAKYRETKGSHVDNQLITPFDYPSCEQMGKSHLLLKSLYSDRLLGLSKMRERSNLVLTGPRGCGKTTVFRASSLDYMISVGDDHPGKMKYVGIYYRCDDLYFAFPRYNLPTREVAFDVPMHFLIVTLLATILEQVAAWARRHFAKEFKEKEEKFVADLWSLLKLSPPNNPTANQLSTLISRLKSKERRRALDKQRFANVEDEPVENYFGPGMMIEACQLIKNRFSFLESRPFYLFIDDYSDPKITYQLQMNLNRLLMYRSPDVFFKLSTESPVSFARRDIDGKNFVESREYDLLNLGLHYLTDDSDKRREFLEDLFSRRFREVDGYPVQSLEQLLGSLPRNENATARILRGERQGKDKSEEESGYYSGCETIAAMCSGDIHYMIRLVGRMVEDHGGREDLATSNNRPRIPFRSQNNSIRAAAGEFLESIRTLPGRGPHLANVIAAFGNVAHSHLLYRTSTNVTGNPPHQASRIEPYEVLQLSDEASNILNDLLRYSILIEDPRGKSRRGMVVPRYYLRRYLIPHFLLTFSRRDSLQLENNQLETFLSEPKEFERTMRLRSKGDATRRRRRDRRRKEDSDPSQERLFDDA